MGDIITGHSPSDGQYSFRDLVDIDQLRELFKHFSLATGFTTGLVSYPEQELLLSTGWRDICTKFHRAAPLSKVYCKVSNLELTSKLKTQHEVNIRHCENGLVDGATAIIIEGVHRASLFSGQILFNTPNIERFTKQAEKFGYDKKAYIAALKETPVVTETQFKNAMLFLTGMASMLAEQGLRKLRLHRTKEELRKNKTHLRTLVNTLPDMISLKDPNGVFMSCNPRFERFFGAKETEILGKTDFDFVDKDLAEYFRANDQKTITGGKANVSEETLTFADDGHQEIVETIQTPMIDSEGTLVGVLSIARDITKRKKAEQKVADLNRNLENLVAERTRALTEKAHELQEANQRLVSLDSMKSAFLSSVSHELRTPLTSILGFAKLIDNEFLKHYSPLSKEHPELLKHEKRVHNNLEIIVHEGMRLTRIINDVLDLSKIESGNMIWRDSLVSPHEFINEAVTVANGMFTKPGPELVVKVEQALPHVYVDKDKLVQVLINLLNNAEKFTDAGTVKLSAQAANNMLTFSVTDTGKGIPQADLERIFSKFQQVYDEHFENSPKGTGLGLAVSRQIVEHYQGRIWAESKQGQGSTFRFTLPFASEDEQK